jgi:hypothetical protein
MEHGGLGERERIGDRHGVPLGPGEVVMVAHEQKLP